MKRDAMHSAIYVSLIKLADLLHELADQQHRKASSFDLDALHKVIDEQLEDNIKSFAKFWETGQMPSNGLLDGLNERIVHVRSRIRD